MRFYFKFLLSFVFLYSCSTGYVVTTNMNNLATYEPNSYVYTLPKTRLIVNVAAVKNEFTPGPYYMYAEKYLGIKDAKASSEVHYYIDSINVKSQSIPDQDLNFSVRDENYRGVDELLDYYRERALIMREGIVYDNNQIVDLDKEDELVSFADVSIKPFYKLPDNVKNDNDRHPLWEKQMIPKTLEEKAQEAAHFIFKIRKRRFKLMAGQYDVFPEGVALETAIQELTKVEEEYLSLFIGKNNQSKIEKTFMVVPSNDNGIQTFPLFKFSESDGFKDTSGNTGEAVMLQITDLETNAALSQINQTFLLHPNENNIIVRVPDRASVKVLLGSNSILESEMSIYQLGAIVPKYVLPEK